MWGGWYHDEEIMSELRTMKDIAESSENRNSEEFPKAETVVFIDEKAYFNNPTGSNCCHSVNNIRVAMGNTGIPFDMYMTEDAPEILHKYKAAVFTASLPSESGKTAVGLCREMNIPYIQTDCERTYISTSDLRDFLVSAGIHCYNADGNVIYCGNGYSGIHTVSDGVVSICLDKKYRVKQILGSGFEECETDRISLTMNKHDTVLFELNL